MNPYGFREYLLLATVLLGENRAGKGRGSSFFTELMNLQTQGLPVFVEFIESLSSHSTYRLRAYNALSGRKFYDNSFSSKEKATTEWRKVTGLPLSQGTFSEEAERS